MRLPVTNSRALKAPAMNPRALGMPATNSRTLKVPVGLGEQPGLLADEQPVLGEASSRPWSKRGVGWQPILQELVLGGAFLTSQQEGGGW